MYHAIFHCKEIELLWFLSPLTLRTNCPQLLSSDDWVWNFIISEVDEVVETLFVIAHGIWLDQNKICFEGKKLEHQLIISRAMSILQAYKKANDGGLVSVVMDPIETTSALGWRAPEEGCYKLNTDVAMAGELSWGIGIVVRDYQGEVVATGTWQIAGGPEVRVAEGLSVLQALKFAQELCLQNIVIETDCKELFQAIYRAQSGPSYFSSIVNDCIKGSSLFPSCNFLHTKRDANKVAHGLAKLACSSKVSISIEECPLEVASLVFADCNQLPCS